MTWGTAAELFNANQVKFSLDDSGGTLQEVVIMHSYRRTKELNLDRVNTRSGPIDTPTFPLTRFTITATMTKDLYERLDSLCDITANGGAAEPEFRMSANSVTAGSSNDVTVTFNGIVESFHEEAPENGRFTATFVVRAKHGTITVS